MGTTRLGSLTGASGTKQISPAKSSSRSVATCKARRVLPTPPVPVRVTRRISGRCRSVHNTWISSSRPIREVSCAGKLWGRAFHWPAVGSLSAGCCPGISEPDTKRVRPDASSLLASSRASAKACTRSKRCFGFLASAFNTTCSTAGGMVETFSRKDGGGVSACLMAISVNDP